MEGSQNDHIWMQTWLTSIFLMEGKELRSFSHFQILTKIAYPDHSRNLQIDKFWSVSSFTVKLWKSVKMIILKCKDDLQVFNWWMEKNEEVLVIMKFWPRSQTTYRTLVNHTLAEIFKLTNFGVCLHSL